MIQVALKNFDQIVERAKQSFRKQRVVVAGADSENILLGVFDAQDAGFATPVLVGEESKILKTDGALRACKVMRVCPECGKATKPAHLIDADGTKHRVCKKCSKVID